MGKDGTKIKIHSEIQPPLKYILYPLLHDTIFFSIFSHNHHSHDLIPKILIVKKNITNIICCTIFFLLQDLPTSTFFFMQNKYTGHPKMIPSLHYVDFAIVMLKKI